MTSYPPSMQQEDRLNALDSEISLIDIVNFVQSVWKKLAISAAVGAVLGLGGWFILGNYSAEYVLLNNNNGYALDLVSWKILQKSLPNLADQIIDENKVPDNQFTMYRRMSNELWWQKNIAPSYAISKADTKDLAGISKDLDSASTTILNFTLTASGSSRQQAADNVRATSHFLRSGGAYLQIRALLNGYESQALSMVSALQQKIADTQVEMVYQEDRIRHLEDLRKRFPGNSSTAGQVVDATDASAKYLPLQTQIIAANNDLNNSKEMLVRAQKRLDQLALTKTFLEQALPLQDQTFDGLRLSQELLEIESNLRSKLAKDDGNGAQFLNVLRSQLLDIQVRFTKGLEANTAPTSTGKKGMIKAIVGGLAVALMLMLMFLLGQKAWVSVKRLDPKGAR